MSKVITSPIKRWQGSVTIADPMTLPQVEAYEAGLKLPDDIKPDEKGNIFSTIPDKQALAGLFACVEKWELQNFPDPVTPENFPFSPRGASHKLIQWIYTAIGEVYNGELDIPNE